MTKRSALFAWLAGGFGDGVILIQAQGTDLALHFCEEGLLTGQGHAVAAGEDFFLALVEDVADNGVVLVGAEDDAERGVVVRAGDLAVVVVHIELHLAEVGFRS